MIDSVLRGPTARRIARALVSVLRSVTPTHGQVVVNGWPDLEGNAVEVVRSLLASGRHDVCWLVDYLSPDQAAAALGNESRPSRLSVVRKRSVAGLWAYLTAPVVLFSHGLYLNPPPRGRKVVVNLWHGDGPKSNPRTAATVPPSSTYVVAGTRLFGRLKAASFNVPLDNLLLTGNPRCDQLFRPLSDDALAALGLRRGVPLMLVMPTYRSAKAVGTTRSWDDAARSPREDGGHLTALVTEAEAAGWQVVVKPHPLDARPPGATSARVVTDGDLRDVGANLYALLGRADALVTDYSSVWTDYLTLRRPVAFLLDDLEDYASGRGLDVDDLPSLLPGPVLRGRADAADFVRRARDGDAALIEHIERSVEAIGLVTAGPFADNLLRELEDRGVLLRAL